MKSHSKNLLDRAVLAMAGAVELYNKPGFPYRNESFVVLAINAWELLLKARWLALHNHKRKVCTSTSLFMPQALEPVRESESNGPDRAPPSLTVSSISYNRCLTGGFWMRARRRT